MTILDYIYRGSLLISLLISVIYGIVIIVKNKDCKPIFKVALLGLVSLFIARIYFIVLDIAKGNDEIFSVGIIGQIAAYLFLYLVNKSYIPFDYNENSKISIISLLVSLIPLFLFSFIVIKSFSISALICSILYVISIGLVLYYATRNLTLIKNDIRFKQIKLFNICLITLTILSTIGEVIAILEESLFLNIVSIILTFIACISIMLMLPLLKKGVLTYDN